MFKQSCFMNITCLFLRLYENAPTNRIRRKPTECDRLNEKNSFVIFHSKILSFCAFHILTNNLKQELINEVNFFVSTFFFQLWYNGEFNTIHYFIREIIKIQILGIHAIKIQSLVISKSNMIIHLMDFSRVQCLFWSTKSAFNPNSGSNRWHRSI